MTMLQTIESQVAALSKEDLAAFSAWFDDYQAEMWGRQIEADSRAGRLYCLAGRAMRDDAAGKSTPL